MYKSVLINTKGNSNKYRKLTPKKYSNKNFHNLNNNKKKDKYEKFMCCEKLDCNNVVSLTYTTTE